MDRFSNFHIWLHRKYYFFVRDNKKGEQALNNVYLYVSFSSDGQYIFGNVVDISFTCEPWTWISYNRQARFTSVGIRLGNLGFLKASSGPKTPHFLTSYTSANGPPTRPLNPGPISYAGTRPLNRSVVFFLSLSQPKCLSELHFITLKSFNYAAE